MQNKKSSRFALSLLNARWLAPSALMAAGVLAASACTLTPPPAKDLVGRGNGAVCGSSNMTSGTDAGTMTMSGDDGGTTTTTGPGSTAGAPPAGPPAAA